MASEFKAEMIKPHHLTPTAATILGQYHPPGSPGPTLSPRSPTTGQRQSVKSPKKASPIPPPLPVLQNCEGIARHQLSALLKQSVRWCRLSETLWGLIVGEAQRSVDRESLGNFIEVINWRAQGKISEQEFTHLFSEWIGEKLRFGISMASNTSSSNLRSSGGSNGKQKFFSVNVMVFRQLLSDLKCLERDLDLYVGIVLHEINNLIFLNAPINFAMGNRDMIANKDATHIGLEVCSKNWLSLMDELFFCLDSSGYGQLGFEEIFFFIGCLTVGLHGWADEMEAEMNLSLGILCARTLQMMRDMDVKIHLAASEKEEVKYCGFGLGKYVVTLPMLKHYFLKNAIGESDLILILNHVKNCIERIAKLSSEGAEELFASCHPLEDQQSLGSPRLWQEAVTGAAYYDVLQYVKAPGIYDTLPPALLIMLTDAEKMMSGSFRALEKNIDIPDNFFVSLPSSWTLAQLDLHENACKLYEVYSHWGSSNAIDISRGPLEIRSDPVYKFIVTSLVDYKNLQLQLCAAFFDMATTHYSTDSAVDSIRSICTNLMPHAENVSKELFLDGAFINSLCPKSSNKVDDALKDTMFAEIMVNANDVYQTLEGSASSTAVSHNIYPESEFPDFLRPMLQPQGSDDEIGKAQWKSIISTSPSLESTLVSSMESTSHSNIEDVALNKLSLANRNTYANNIDENQVHSSPNFENNEAFADTSKRDSVEENILLKLLTTSSTSQQLALVDKLRQHRLQKGNLKNHSESTDTLLERDYTKHHIDSTHLRGGDDVIDPPKRDSRRGMKYALINRQEQQQKNLQERKTLKDRHFNSTSSPSPTKSSPPSTLRTQSPSHAKRSDLPTQTIPKDTSPAADSSDNISINDSTGNVSEHSSVPSSIAELLEQGQSAGKYAQTLREILRKMSKDDSKVNLKSLEQVLRLGQTIVQNESSTDIASTTPRTSAARKESGIGGVNVNHNGAPKSLRGRNNGTPMQANSSPMQRNLRIGRNTSTPLKDKISDTSEKGLHPTSSYSSSSPFRNSSNGVKRAEIRSVPGTIPKGSSMKSMKVFGHPL